MTVRKMPYLNPLYRWRWDVPGMYGYATTKRGATRAARAHLMSHSGSTNEIARSGRTTKEAGDA